MTMNVTKSKGRKPKGKETRKAVTFRLQPAIIDRIRTISADTGCSMADIIEDMVMECYP